MIHLMILSMALTINGMDYLLTKNDPQHPGVSKKEAALGTAIWFVCLEAAVWAVHTIITQ